MNNKNPETDTGVQAEDEKSKAISQGLLPLPQTEVGDPASRNPQTETESETCLRLFYMPL